MKQICKIRAKIENKIYEEYNNCYNLIAYCAAVIHHYSEKGAVVTA